MNRVDLEVLKDSGPFLLLMKGEDNCIVVDQFIDDGLLFIGTQKEAKIFFDGCVYGAGR